MEDDKVKHYVSLSTSRELTDVEFNSLTDIIEDEIGDIISNDEVYEYPLNGMMCYTFELWTDVKNCEQGESAVDIINYELDQILPSKVKWKLNFK
jgi:hypothetical protein